MHRSLVLNSIGNKSLVILLSTFFLFSIPFLALANTYGDNNFGAGVFGAGEGSSSGGGGGGGGSSSADAIITLAPSVISDTGATLSGSIADGRDWSIYFVISSQDQTPQCSDSGDTYTVLVLKGVYDKGDVYGGKVLKLSPNTTYYYLACGKNSDGDNDSGLRKSFKTARLGEVVSSYPSATATSQILNAAAFARIPSGFFFRNNISFIQPLINDKEEVRQLANFLNAFEGEQLVEDVIYGVKDMEAVKRFQQKYHREVLDVWNLSEATGYVGITTRLKMNYLLKGQSVTCPVFTEYHGGTSDTVTASSQITEVQKILSELGFYSGPLDGIWDQEVTHALIYFQEKFHEVMLDPWGLSQGTGRQYKTTNKFLNYFVGCDTGVVELDGEGTFDF